MLRKLLMAAPFILLVQACGTIQFAPTEYPLRDGLITAIDSAGPTTVSNAQDSVVPTFVYSGGGTHLQTDYHAVTEVMVAQTQKELQKAIRTSTGQAKSIALKVNFLQSNYVAYFSRSKIIFEATLGDGTVLHYTASHASGDVRQDLNGCVAEAVMTLLNDPKIRSYLST